MDNTYLAHFGLVEEPYSTLNPRYLYISHPQLGSGKDQVDDHHQTRTGAGVWTGGNRQDHRWRVSWRSVSRRISVSYVFITNPNFPTPNQLLRAINQEFEVPQS